MSTTAEVTPALAHEVRTPLYAVRGLVELLLAEADLGGQARADVEQIDLAVCEALAIIDAQLAAARRRGEGLDRREVRVEDVFARARAAVAPLRRPGVELSWEVAEGAGVLWTDPDELLLVVRNLVGNALKFTAAGDVTVTMAHAGLGDVVLEVADSGPGIARDDQGRVFERWETSGAAAPVAGSGLGLALVRRAVRRLGGTIALTSRPGVGTVFTVVLPQRAG